MDGLWYESAEPTRYGRSTPVGEVDHSGQLGVAHRPVCGDLRHLSLDLLAPEPFERPGQAIELSGVEAAIVLKKPRLVVHVLRQAGLGPVRPGEVEAMVVAVVHVVGARVVEPLVVAADQPVMEGEEARLAPPVVVSGPVVERARLQSRIDGQRAVCPAWLDRPTRAELPSR